MTDDNIGVMKQELPNGCVVGFWYDKTERKAMGETKFRKLLGLWLDGVISELSKEQQDGIISAYERNVKQEGKK